MFATTRSSSSSMALALCLALVALLSFTPSVSSAPTVLYVNGVTGSDSNNGTSSSSPLRTLSFSVEVMCKNVNPEYVVVIAAVQDFIYSELVTFPTGCEALSATFTPVDPSDPVAAKLEEVIDMPQLAWKGQSSGAIMSLTFDHINFTSVYLSMHPTLDLGSTATYSLTVQNCLFDNFQDGDIDSHIDLGTNRVTLKSGLVLNFVNNIVRNTVLQGDLIYTRGVTSITLNILNSQFINNSVAASSPRLLNGNTANVAVIDSCTFHNNSFIDLLFYAVAPTPAASQATAFNFTNNIVSFNTIGGLLDVAAEYGPTFITGNRIENNVMKVSAASAYFGTLTEPIVITDNIYTCNVQFANYYPPLFTGRAPPNTNWVLSNNQNGNPDYCEIVPGPGMTMADAINAIPCAAGTSNPGGPGDSVCYPCEAGTYANQPGSASCTYCPQGSFAAATGAVQCSVCPIGTHASSQGATACQDCNSGQYASQTGEIACQTCAPGTCTPSAGAWSSCEAAPCTNSSAISLE